MIIVRILIYFCAAVRAAEGVCYVGRHFDQYSESRSHAFSKGQKKIASYILTNYDKAAFMTASRLGKTVEVSESTVVRFAVELGYEGYPEMQKTLQELVRNKLTSVQRIEVASDQFGKPGRCRQRSAARRQRHPHDERRRSTAAQMARAVERDPACAVYLYRRRALVRGAGQLSQFLFPQYF